MKKILHILALLLLIASPASAQTRLIFAGGCHHFASNGIRYNETGNFPLGLSIESDSKEIAFITYIDSYHFRSYAAWITGTVVEVGPMELRFGAGLTYKQLDIKGLKALVCFPLPILRLNIDRFGIDFTAAPAGESAVIMGIGSFKI